VYDPSGNPAAVEGIVTDITELKRKEEELAALAKEKQDLMREINHRVTNNLLTVEACAYLELKQEQKSKRESIEDIISRIRAIQLIHHKLYSSCVYNQINISLYLRELIETITTSLTASAGDFALSVDIEELHLPVKLNTTLGIITAELLTNTFKYAGCGSGCEITVFLTRDAEGLRFVYRDSGTGLRGKVAHITELNGGAGIMLITELVGGLSGSIELNTDNGTEFRFSIPFPGE
jgi:two-component sensor histidine kinase